MKILYIYPHPDDESFGPAHVMAKQIREGHKVYLLTLTKGGATSQRFKFNYSIKKMGQVRVKEMLCVQKVLGLTGMTILDLPDSGLKEMDPREIELVVKEHIEEIEPRVIVTYPVHGISGFHDHLITHAVVKRVFVELSSKKWYLKRLAFTAVTETEVEKIRMFKLHSSKQEEIDCIITVDEKDIHSQMKALDCYQSYTDTITGTGIKNVLNEKAYFEFYREKFDPPVDNLFDKLPNK